MEEVGAPLILSRSPKSSFFFSSALRGDGGRSSGGKYDLPVKREHADRPFLSGLRCIVLQMGG